nr:heavy metal-associated isoprenylated plant protein 39-like isoform X2 [Erigeron canadensis]
MKAISSVKGIESINFDMNSKKLTVVGIFDPICGFDKLDKVCETELLVVEVVKQEEKKEEPKKEEPKKEEEKKEPNETYRVWNYEPHYNPRMPQGGYYVIMEENPNPNCCLIS